MYSQNNWLRSALVLVASAALLTTPILARAGVRTGAVIFRQKGGNHNNTNDGEASLRHVLEAMERRHREDIADLRVQLAQTQNQVRALQEQCADNRVRSASPTLTRMLKKEEEVVAGGGKGDEQFKFKEQQDEGEDTIYIELGDKNIDKSKDHDDKSRDKKEKDKDKGGEGDVEIPVGKSPGDWDGGGNEPIATGGDTDGEEKKQDKQEDSGITLQGLQERIRILENITKALECISSSSDKNDVYFEGCNVHIRNGANKTASENWRGNLIVGYNEANNCFGKCRRRGSHNVIVGPNHEYTRHGGLVVGYRNSITGNYSSVTGGIRNAAVQPYSSVSGGQNNRASGRSACVTGGEGGVAKGISSAVAGGMFNYALGVGAAVSGGIGNTANSNYASVSGGQNNNATFLYTSILGGLAKTTTEGYQTIS